MKRFPLIVAGIVILVFGVWATQASLSEAAPKNIPVGVCTGLTGHFAGFGGGGVFGIKAAVEDINNLGGVYVKEYGKKIPIKLSILDNESDETKAGTLAQNLILQDKVSFIVNGIDPPHMRAPIATVCERYKVVHITGVGPYEAWMGMRKSLDRPWQYTWTPSFAIATPAKPGDFRAGKLGYVMMDPYMQMMKKLKGLTNRRVALFASDEPDGRGWYLAFVPVMKKNGFDLYRAEEEFGLVPMETTDFSSLIRQWKKYKCEILWANCPGPFFGAMWRQARRMGFKPKQVYATRAAVFYPDIVGWGGNLAHGVCNEMFWNPSIQDSPGIGSTTPQSLNERWIKESGESMHQNVGMGYQSVQILIDAIERAGSLDTEKVNQALRKTDLMTIYQRVVLDDENFSRHPVSFGQWIRVDKPWKWDNPVVISNHDFLPATADLLFPIPYD
ncbi:MAG: ABC transporter substrate-binding protein [Deltaproteobacteria bacterium]|nr:ABC transporter substrate-binding protein [Deltaproteobacteria bacterium]